MSLAETSRETCTLQSSPAPALMELQSEIERISQRLKLKSEKRKYCPHITLARLCGTSALEAAGFIASRGGFHSRPFDIKEFQLLSSKDSIGGGPYKCEERFALKVYHEPEWETPNGFSREFPAPHG